MFKKFPRVLAHVSAIITENFVISEYILHKTETGVDLFRRFCPHRMYPLATPGTLTTEITCKFHGLHWTADGTPTNNNKKISCGTATVGESGLIFKDFDEVNHRWVTDLAKETNLKYSHSVTGSSKGSWLWLMDAEADLLHVYKGGIHPFLSQQINLEDIKLDQGDGWILQNHPNGWWLYIFPFSFVEYGNSGMVMVNTVTPHSKNSEYGFDWISQFYYDPTVTPDRRAIFETLETVFNEDIATAELQKGDYFPLAKAMNRYEDHCVHFGKWYQENLIK
jgi:hypothetical protein